MHSRHVWSALYFLPYFHLSCSSLYCGNHSVVNPIVHVSQCVGWLWQQPTTVKVHNALDPSGGSSSQTTAMSRGCRIYYRISMAVQPYAIHNYRHFFTQEEPCQKGWARFALVILSVPRKFGNGAHRVTPYSPCSDKLVYIHTLKHTVYGRFQASRVAKSFPSFWKSQVTKHPSQLMQCCPPSMSKGRRMYCHISRATLPYSIEITVFWLFRKNHYRRGQRCLHKVSPSTFGAVPV